MGLNVQDLRPDTRSEEDLRLLRKVLMAYHQITVASLAREWGCSQGFASEVTLGNRRSAAKEQDLARRLKRPWSDLFNPPRLPRRGDVRDPLPPDGEYPK